MWLLNKILFYNFQHVNLLFIKHLLKMQSILLKRIFLILKHRKTVLCTFSNTCVLFRYYQWQGIQAKKIDWKNVNMDDFSRNSTNFIVIKYGFIVLVIIQWHNKKNLTSWTITNLDPKLHWAESLNNFVNFL